MTRPLRIEYPDAFYHVMNRGRGRCDIFEDDVCFELFLKTLAEAHERFNLQVHAFCLMSNHYHLLVKTPDGNLQRAMRHVNGIYTQRYNKLKKTDGALFRGRYKSILVDADSYLLHLSKYIHLNPLNAGMVARLDKYRWSSYCAYIGLRSAEQWLYLDQVYGQLNTSQLESLVYRSYVEDGQIDDGLIRFYQAGKPNPILGDDRFREDVKGVLSEDLLEISYYEKKKLKPDVARIVEEVAFFYGVTEGELLQVKKGRGMRNQPRQLAMYLAQRVGGCRLREVADYFGLNHYGGVSYAVSMIKVALADDETLRLEVNIIINRLDPLKTP